MLLCSIFVVVDDDDDEEEYCMKLYYTIYSIVITATTIATEKATLKPDRSAW